MLEAIHLLIIEKQFFPDRLLSLGVEGIMYLYFSWKTNLGCLLLDKYRKPIFSNSAISEALAGTSLLKIRFIILRISLAVPTLVFV